MVAPILLLRLTHTGLLADGRPNPASVMVTDLDTGLSVQSQKTPVYVPPGGSILVPFSSASLYSYTQGNVARFVSLGVLSADVFIRLRNPADQNIIPLAPINPNFQRTVNIVTCVINSTDASGYVPGEAIALDTLGWASTITQVVKHEDLLGPNPLYFLVRFVVEGPNIAPAQIAGNLSLPNGKVTVELSGSGNAGGLGPDSILYVGGNANIIQGIDPSFINFTDTSSAAVPHNSIFTDSGDIFFKDEAGVVVSLKPTPGAGVSSWAGRDGAVVPEPGDYETGQITNTSAVPGATLNDVLASLGGAGVSSWAGRTGVVLPEAGDYETGQIANSSSVAGATLNDALANLDGQSGVFSFEGRVGAVLAAQGDYETSQITNTSVVPGATLNDALDYLTNFEFVMVETVADLPAPVGGVRTLEAGKCYWILNIINIGTDILTTSGELAIKGIYPLGSRIITSNASALLTSTFSLSLHSVALTNLTGPALSVAGAIPADPSVAVRATDSIFSGVSASGVVQIQDCDGMGVNRSTWTGCEGVGLRVQGSIRGIIASEIGAQNNNPGLVWLQVPAGVTVTGRIALSLCSFNLTGGLALDVDPSAMGIERLNVFNSSFSTVGLVSGVTADSNEAFFFGNNNLENTYPKAAIRIENNATSVAFVQNVWQKLAGTTTPTSSRLFDLSVPNRITYNGARRRQMVFTSFATLQTSNNNQILQLAYAINGVVDVSFTQRGTTTGSSGNRLENLPLLGIFNLSPGDYVELWARDLSANTIMTWIDGQITATE